jgi:hypothetical protein
MRQREMHSDDAHPFGGCSKLLNQYRTIGRMLMRYERSSLPFQGMKQKLPREFSCELANVPVEVLESYLDDLLDIGVTDESLFIKRGIQSAIGAYSVLALVAVCGMFQVWDKLSLARSMMIPVSLFFAIMFLAGSISGVYLLSRTKMLRRYTFANLMTHEIEKRRGGTAHRTRLTPTSLVNDLFVRPYSDGQQPPLRPHAARVMTSRYYH